MSLATFEHQDVERFTHDFESLFNAGDAAGMAAFYADDARLLAEDTEPVRGREAIERFWRAACDQARAGDHHQVRHDLAARGRRPVAPGRGHLQPRAR